MSERHDDEPFYVPVELERDHLVAARRTVVRSTQMQRPHRRAAQAVRRPSTPRSRARTVATAVHLLAALLLIALAAMTETWMIAVVLTGVVGVSLLVVLRLIDLAQQPVVNEPQY